MVPPVWLLEIDGYPDGVADLILAFVLVLLACAGAELVRATCRRSLLAPAARPAPLPSTQTSQSGAEAVAA